MTRVERNPFARRRLPFERPEPEPTLSTPDSPLTAEERFVCVACDARYASRAGEWIFCPLCLQRWEQRLRRNLAAD
jgi:hypothetical protein